MKLTIELDREVDRIAHGELPPDSANAIFDVAA